MCVRCAWHIACLHMCVVVATWPAPAAQTRRAQGERLGWSVTQTAHKNRTQGSRSRSAGGDRRGDWTRMVMRHAWSCGACHPSTFADVADFRFRVHDSRLSRGGRARAGSEQTDPWDNGRGQGLRRWKFFRHVVARPAFRVLHVPVSDDPVLRRHMHPQGARAPRGGTTGAGAGEGAGAIGDRGRYTGSSATRICWLHLHVCVCTRTHVHTYACANVHTTAHADASVICPHHVHTAPSPAINDAFL